MKNYKKCEKLFFSINQVLHTSTTSFVIDMRQCPHVYTRLKVNVDWKY